MKRKRSWEIRKSSESIRSTRHSKNSPVLDLENTEKVSDTVDKKENRFFDIFKRKKGGQ